MQRIIGSPFRDISPETYVFPQDVNKFIAAAAKDRFARWISKPYAKSRGEGIQLWDRGAEEAAACARLAENSTTVVGSETNAVPNGNEGDAVRTFLGKSLLQKKREILKGFDPSKVIVQRYLDDPFLLDGLKFDLRLYVAVTSVDPLSIYLFDDGLARFCTEKYDPSVPFHNTSENGGDKSVLAHLTNSSLNVYSDKYVRNVGISEEELSQGSKRGLAATLARIGKLFPKIDIVKLWLEIGNVVTKAFIAFEPILVKESRRLEYQAENGYELFGVDIMLMNSDDKTEVQPKPVLLELNFMPQIDAAMPMDKWIKGVMMADLMHLVGHKLPPALDEKFRKKYNAENEKLWFVAKHDELLKNSESETVRMKQEEYNGRMCAANEHPDYLPYFRMLRMGLPRFVVEQKMKQEELMRPNFQFNLQALDEPTMSIPWPEPDADFGSGAGNSNVEWNVRDLFQDLVEEENAELAKVESHHEGIGDVENGDDNDEDSCFIENDAKFIRRIVEERRRIGHWHHIFPRWNPQEQGLQCSECAEMFSLRSSRKRYRRLAKSLEKARESGLLCNFPVTRSMGGIDYVAAAAAAVKSEK
eukprot:g208.t1